MPKITFLPHSKICPEGKVIEAPTGTTICNAALGAGIAIEHARAVALEVRGHRNQRAHRHHAGAAHAGDQQIVGPAPVRIGGQRQRIDVAPELA